MLVGSRLFGRRAPRGPRGHRVYAVGDVHGCLNLLHLLLGKIEDDVRSRGRARTTIIFLGDLIDRGPDSAGVLEFLSTYQPAFAKTAFLSGNHEEVLLRVLEGDESLFSQWMKFGGAECMRSYGLDPRLLKKAPPAEAISMLNARIPHSHVEFLRSFSDSVSFGGFLFVHAGIRPGTRLVDQTQADLRWIREPFLEDERDHGAVVIHGHTIFEDVQERPNRIGIDTGAYRTGLLTAIGIEEDERWFLQAGDPHRVRAGLPAGTGTTPQNFGLCS